MKKLLFFLLLFVGFTSVGQAPEQTCTYTKFKNGKNATAKCVDEQGSGTATAYNLKGEAIGTWTVSRMHQLSSVYFTFHPNGMVHKAEYSSHPDAGIQWYQSTTEYNEEGVKIGFWEQSNDDRVTLIEPIVPKSPVVMDSVGTTYKNPIKQDVVECAVIYVSELWLDNRTGKDIKVTWKHKYLKDQQGESIIKAGERIKICERILAQQYEAPMSNFELTVTNLKGKTLKNAQFSSPLINDEHIKEFRKGYIYDVSVKK